jgi:L-lactate dehydrogenase complex protein LldE
VGIDVEFAAAQTCCGQPMVNSGYPNEAVPVARTFVDAFSGYDAVVTPPGSCAASARHQHALVAWRSRDLGSAAAGAEVAPTVYELSELLVDVLGVVDVGAYFPHTVTSHPTCQSVPMAHVGDRPQRLLRMVSA